MVAELNGTLWKKRRSTNGWSDVRQCRISRATETIVTANNPMISGESHPARGASISP